jgi:predicted ArsR family transcriptional regulator
LYSVAATEVSVQLPPRDDALLSRLLAAAVLADETGGTRAAVEREARAEGARAAAEHRDRGEALTDLLARRGYAPCFTDDDIRMRNCPFHHLVESHRELVCGLNLALLDAATAALDTGYRAELDPSPDFCCVALRRDPPPPSVPRHRER